MVAPDGSFDVNTGETVNIADLVVVQAARSTVSSEHVQVLAGAPTELPPILVHRSTMQVVDGYHRVQAALLNGATKIRARFFDGSEAEAFVEAVRQNVAHGLPLSLADRKTAAARLIASHPSYSNRAIARTTGLSDGTVRSLRTFETVDGGDGACRGLDGRVRPSTTAEGRIRAHKLIQSNPDVPLRTVANRAGISLGTAHDVRNRLQRGDDPVPPHQRQRHATVSTRSPSPAPPEAERIESAGDRSPGGPPPGGGPIGTPIRPDVPPAPAPPKRTPQALLEALYRDPTLRFNEHGRRVLRWFMHGAMPDEEWRSFLPHVPMHQAGAMAEIARRSAQSWAEFAREIERLDGKSG